FWAAFQLDPLAVKLLPVAVFMLVFYSYTKRFTWLCHLILGLTIGLAPLGGWVAVSGAVSLPAMVLYRSVALWTAGIDVVSACQDVDFDRREGLYSIPARFGIARGLMLARLFHLLTASGFVVLMALTELSWWYLAGTALACGILVHEHRLVRPHDLSRLDAAFFTMNGILSMVVFFFTFIDLVVARAWQA